MGIKSSIDILIRTIRKNTIADDWLTIVFEIPASHTLRGYVTTRQYQERLCENGGLLLKQTTALRPQSIGDLHAALISLTVVVQA